MSTLLCVPIMVQDEASALADAASAREAGADLVEFRIDEVFHGAGDDAGERTAINLASKSPLPCIVTCRAADEGGHYDGDDAARVALYERLGTASGHGEHPPRYIDVELATYTRSPNLRQKVDLAVRHAAQRRELTTSLILSAHDFAGRPPDLTRRALAMRAEPAANVLKIAYRARSIRDNLELFDLLAHRDRPMIALGMGEFGLMSRVLAPKFGGFLTFASLHATTTTAPGQPTVGELLDLYRFRSIGPATAVYGVVGYPLGHTLSPLIHNAGFGEIRQDGVYLPLPVAAGYESLKATLGELIDHAGLGLRGLSVTIPHKENLVRLAREAGWDLDEDSVKIGAANTVAIERDGAGRAVRIRVSNTDAPAVLDALAPSLGAPAGRRVAIIGAGGMARGAAYALARAGAAVHIFARSAERAAALAADIGRACGVRVEGAELGALASDAYEVYVNCTPVGMKGGADPLGSPIPIDRLSNTAPGAVVLDTVYNPMRTPLLASASTAGMRTVDGLVVFLSQAARQFALWTGRPAPTGLWERLVRSRLEG